MVADVYKRQGEKILSCDSIFYNRDTGMGEVYGNMSLIDTAQHVTLQGEYGYYNEQTGYALSLIHIYR